MKIYIYLYMVDVEDFLNRFDQLEAKVEQHEREANQLKKKNSELRLSREKSSVDFNSRR